MPHTLSFLVLLIGAIESARALTEPPARALQTQTQTQTQAQLRRVDTGDSLAWHRRFTRGSKDGKSRHREPNSHPRQPRIHDPEGYFTTPRVFNGSLLLHNPLFPVTKESYSAYAVMLLSLLVFSVGIVGNLAVMCIVWHNYYLQTTWNCVLASMACWDFVLLFFCLPVVIFNELTKRRLMGELSCRIVPFLEVTSLGVTTFSLCALSIDRFRLMTAPSRKPPQLEACGSITAKLSVIWLGSLLLAIPELLLWHLTTESSPISGLPQDTCTRLPSTALPEAVYSLVLTYHEARMWWSFGCYFCLPLLFSLACQLLAGHVVSSSSSSISSSTSSSSSSSSGKKPRSWERQLARTVTALMAVYATFSLPEHAWNIGLSYAGSGAGAEVGGVTLKLLALIGQFLMFARAGATPMLVLCVCRSLGRSFVDCCCCCCEECLPEQRASSSSSSSSTAATVMSSVPSSPVSANKEKLRIVSGTSPAVFFDKVKDGSAEMAIGTPC